MEMHNNEVSLFHVRVWLSLCNISCCWF